VSLSNHTCTRAPDDARLLSAGFSHSSSSCFFCGIARCLRRVSANGSFFTQNAIGEVSSFPLHFLFSPEGYTTLDSFSLINGVWLGVFYLWRLLGRWSVCSTRHNIIVLPPSSFLFLFIHSGALVGLDGETVTTSLAYGQAALRRSRLRDRYFSLKSGEDMVVVEGDVTEASWTGDMTS